MNTNKAQLPTKEEYIAKFTEAVFKHKDDKTKHLINLVTGKKHMQDNIVQHKTLMRIGKMIFSEGMPAQAVEDFGKLELLIEWGEEVLAMIDAELDTFTQQ